MTIGILTGTSDYEVGTPAALYDIVTGRALMCPLFPSKEADEHFLLWAEREGREPFTAGNYSWLALDEAERAWWKMYCPDGELTEQAYRELEEHATCLAWRVWRSRHTRKVDGEDATRLD